MSLAASVDSLARTFCSDGDIRSPWYLSEFAKANAHDPDLNPMLVQILALGVGDSCTLGSGSVATTTITRLS